MEMIVNFYIGCLVVLLIAQNYAAFWPIVSLLAICSTLIIIIHKPRNYGSPIIWAGFCLMAIVALIDGSSWKNLALFPIYGLTFLAGLQIRDTRVSKLFTFLLIPQIVAVIALTFVWPDRGNGGIIDPGDYNVPSALMIVAFLFSYSKWQWMLLPFVIVGMYMTSGEEPIILITALTLAVVVKRDFSRRIWPSIAAVLICATLFFGLHIPDYLYQTTQQQLLELHSSAPLNIDNQQNDLLRGRTFGYSQALGPVSLLGHGMDAWNIKTTSIHNLPLRVLYELGVVGLIAFLLVVICWLVRVNLYLGVVIVVMMLFDHYLWTLIGVWLWAVLGLTYKTTSTYIFKFSSPV